jgi:hypothetical protein
VTSDESVHVGQDLRVALTVAITVGHHRVLRDAERLVDGQRFVVDRGDDSSSVGDAEPSEEQQRTHQLDPLHV